MNTSEKVSAHLLSHFSSKVTTQDPPTITRPEVDPEVVTSVDSSILEESCVYLHCYFSTGSQEMMVRIWRTSYLIDLTSASRSPMLHAENISVAPQWTKVPARTDFSFLLIFSGLPRSCKQFDFKEEIPQVGGFFVAGIARNETDVYHVNLDV